ncbi:MULTISPECIES: ComEC/Rec2 family competence protein [Clostridium]|uniref:ComEC/Rec2 family competence protein n=1 Tax=Clostridium TaxID=1485 RepID=UPI002431696C|nr:ComEC/Rec2 family competence protein [Clostridium tyrobutyricum]
MEKNNIKKLLMFIPGFRSHKAWKMIIASIYYFMAIFIGITDGFGIFLFLIAIPFWIFSIIDLMRHKKKGIPIKKAIIPFFISFALMITGFAISPQAKQITSNSKNVPVKTENIDSKENNINEESESKDTANTAQNKDSKEEKANSKLNGELKIHYINVGQGDSILIQQGNATMLIDAGPDANTTADYLKRQGIKKIDVLVGTHPHADHLSGMPAVINEFNIGKIYMPKVTHTSKIFENTMESIKAKGMKISTPHSGDSFKLGNADCTILAPNSNSYNNLNNYSIVLRIKFGNNSFIFDGDAESLSEGEILQKQLDIQSDVIKLGHHGSRTATSQSYLNKVNPKYAVISCGKGNSYGHPHAETMTKLKEKNIKVYRTDENGTIICTSDGENIKFNCEPGSYNSAAGQSKPKSKSNNTGSSGAAATKTTKPAANPAPKQTSNSQKEETVYITNSGKKYHRTGCKYLNKSCTEIKKSDAVKRGYTPCSKCNP